MDLKKHVRQIPDFPKPGINFFDISTLIRHPEAWRVTIDRMADIVRPWKPDVLAAIDARNEQVYFQVFAPNGTTIVTPRLDRVRAAVIAVPSGPTVVTGSAAELVASYWPSRALPPRVEIHAAPDIGWVARLGAAALEQGAPPKPLYLRRPDARPQDAGRLPRR